MRILNLILSLACINALGKTAPEIIKEWERQATKGDPSAQIKMGRVFEVGLDPITKDPVVAASWYQRAADQGDAEAQLIIGNKYYLGEGVVKNYVYAYTYFNLAASRTNTSLGGLAQASRAMVESVMTPSQIEAGQKLSLELQKEIDAKNTAKKQKK